jgi:hypothetical protein
VFRVLGMPNIRFVNLLAHIPYIIVSFRISTLLINCLKHYLQDCYLFVIFSQLGKIPKVTRRYIFDKVTILWMRNGM